jgi:hypothetical protein
MRRKREWQRDLLGPPGGGIPPGFFRVRNRLITFHCGRIVRRNPKETRAEKGEREEKARNKRRVHPTAERKHEPQQAHGTRRNLHKDQSGWFPMRVIVCSASNHVAEFSPIRSR